VKLTLLSIRPGKRQRGWALLVVLTLVGCGLMLLASVMSWAAQNAAVVNRNNEYFATSYAAEAATEKVLATMFQQYQNYGFSLVSQNMSTYATTIPTATDSPYWTNYLFSGGQTANQIIVTNTATAQTVVMGAPYAGLNLVENTYQIIANAQNASTEFKIVSTVGQQIFLGTIPMFQFAIFYEGDMEIAPGAAMTINGAVHGNANIYLDPQAGLTFGNTVSAVDQIYLNASPLDPSSRTFSSVTFNGSPQEAVEVNPLNLPVGTNTTGTVSNTSQNVYAILQMPTAGQTPTSATGTNLLYNRADMIIIVSNNNTITVTSGASVNSQATVVPNSQWQSFLNTNGSFYDQRDSLPVNPVVLNVSNLVNWSATNTVLRPVLSSLRGSGAADVQSIYVADLRGTSNAIITTNYYNTTNFSTNSITTPGLPALGTYVPPITYTNTTLTTTTSRPATNTYVGTITTNRNGFSQITGYTYYAITGYVYNAITTTVYTNATCLTNWPIVSQPGIVLSNGAVLPPQGLSIATPDPAYVMGNWNVQLTKSGTSDAASTSSTPTAYSLPSAIYADAITILSSAWNPANSTLSLSSRNATSDTVNAAFLTGNVPSNGSFYSGGVENFARFLENWSGQTFYYNGSMVCMFASQIANAPWPGTGTVYQPPTRTWAFDKNFSNPSKEPPMTPQILSVLRSKWSLLTPYATSF
jgi:hypothetical protein